MTRASFHEGPAPRDLAALRDLLDSSESEGSLTFAELPGFLFALACAPETVAPSEWLTEVLGDEPALDDEVHAQRVFDGLVAWYNEINSGVLEGNPQLPSGYSFKDVVLENFNAGAAVAAWSSGFFRGHSWLSEDWDEYLFEEIELEVLTCVFSLSFFHSRELAQAAADDENLPLEDLSARIRDLFESSMASYANIGRSVHEALMEQEEQAGLAARRPFVTEPAVGRNDACPCGSGLKYKRCCGRNVH